MNKKQELKLRKELDSIVEDLREEKDTILFELDIIGSNLEIIRLLSNQESVIKQIHKQQVLLMQVYKRINDNL